MNNTDYDFLHSLEDTISLLGAPVKIRRLISKLIDKNVTQSDVDDLAEYNCTLFASAKGRLAYLHTIKIKPQGDE